MTARKFKFPVPAMLVSAVTAGKNMEANMGAFAKDYPDWTTDRLNAFYARIEEMSAVIGIKGNREQHEATVLLRKMAEDAIDAAATVKSQMERGFRKESARLKELLQLLGFTKNWTKANNGNQTALIDLMHTFNNNTGEAALKELEAHGVVIHRIDSMKNASRELTAANITQETLKSEAPVITEEMNIQLNEIYDTAIDICSAGKTVFRKDPVRKSLFSFAKLIAQQTFAAKPKTGENPEKTDVPS